MPSGTFVLKLDVGGDVRRVQRFQSTSIKYTEEVQQVVAQTYGLGLPQVLSCTLKYQDQEGELCTFVDSTIPDAVDLAVQSKTMRLTVLMLKVVDAEEVLGQCGGEDEEEVGAAKENNPQEPELVIATNPESVGRARWR